MKRNFIQPFALMGCAVLTIFSGIGCAGLSWLPFHPTMAVPETYPLGSVTRAHFHTMQTNAEAADFIMHRGDFVGSTAKLTPYGRDRILEIAARARNAPFPILVERTENNSDPELDEFRRNMIAQILYDHGIPEADQRVFVSPAYGRGLNSREAEWDYYQFIFSRRGNGFGNGNRNGFNGGFGNNVGSFGAGGGIGFF
ncbi:MAG: hypothetical protein Tsb009_00640 [Planctomycetaceae bacterium]